MFLWIIKTISVKFGMVSEVL